MNALHTSKSCPPASRNRYASAARSKHPSQENALVYDVLIAGAGPVGLFLACELWLAKPSV